MKRVQNAAELQKRVPLDRVVREIRRFRIRDVLRAANDTCRSFEDHRRRPYQIDRQVVVDRQIQQETLIFGQHTLAFLAKQSILHGSDLRSAPLGGDEFAELVSLHGNLDDGLDTDPSAFDSYAFLLRTAWEQFSYQDSLTDLIPRYFTLFKTINKASSQRVVDMEHALLDCIGLSVEDFMVLGFAAWAACDQHSLVYDTAFLRSEIPAIAHRVHGGNLERLLAVIAADYERFREESRRFATNDPGGARTEFNVLRTFPIIRPKRGELIAPVPQFIIERVTRGIFFILQSALSTPRGNPFTEQFGYDFEDYVGFLLTKRYGSAAVVHEPVYGKEHRRGPDWIVREGATLLLFECTGSGTTLATKSRAQFDSVANDLAKMYVKRIREFPTKIEALRSGTAGVDTQGVTRFVPVIVTHEPLYVEPIVRSYLDNLLKGERTILSDVKLIDIGDIEVTTGWIDLTLGDLFDGWADVYAKHPQSFRPFLEDKARGEGLPWQNPYLKEVFDTFFKSEFNIDVVGG